MESENERDNACQIQIVEESNPIEVSEKKRAGRPKKAKAVKQKAPKREEPVADAEPAVTVDPVQEYEEFLEEQMGVADVEETRQAFKKLFLNNKGLLDHLTIKRISKMGDAELLDEYAIAKIVVNSQVTQLLSDQLVSFVNGAVTYVLGLGGDFDEFVQQDGLLLSCANNILNDSILGALNDKLQFALLYSSKVLHFKKTEQKRKHLVLVAEARKRMEEARQLSAPAVDEEPA